MSLMVENTVVPVNRTFLFFFSSRRRHTRSKRDWSSDVCSSDLWRVTAFRTLRCPRSNVSSRPEIGHQLNGSMRDGPSVAPYFGLAFDRMLGMIEASVTRARCTSAAREYCNFAEATQSDGIHSLNLRM